MSGGKTRVAVLGTLAQFHAEAIAFDLKALLDLVIQMNPDLLCLDITSEQWRQRRFEGLPMEYREALLPLAERSDIVVVPIGGDDQPGPPQASGWRAAFINWLRSRLEAIQRGAPSPEAANYGWRHDLANVLYYAMAWLASGDLLAQRTTHAEGLVGRIRQAVDRDPGSRILAVVNVQYCHRIRPALREDPQIEVVPFADFGG